MGNGRPPDERTSRRVGTPKIMEKWRSGALLRVASIVGGLLVGGRTGAVSSIAVFYTSTRLLTLWGEAYAGGLG